ncbi:adrenocortical dysplasia protein homolog isoform X2 [Patagioenas fasciata]|uniref:adrenocortical dysplasia protein homolog isoform X2 n=1 Tax=Patagioenas fasciata TaxID=372321 RepID=UPI003A9A5F47
MAAAAAACPGGAGAGEQPEGRRSVPGPSFEYEDKNMVSPKLYILQPWIANLLVNYEQLDANENLLAGQVLRILSDSTVPDHPGVLQDAVLQVSDGSYYIRVVITSEALRAEEKWVPPRLGCGRDSGSPQLLVGLPPGLVSALTFSSDFPALFAELLSCRSTQCVSGRRPGWRTASFTSQHTGSSCCPWRGRGWNHLMAVKEGGDVEQVSNRLYSYRRNQEPSVMQKIKELWLRSLTLKNAPSSEPSISQLIDAIGQNQLEVLKEKAEECLDLQVPKETPAMGKDEVPITQWEEERKKEGIDVFKVPANTLVIPPEEEAVPCDASNADTCEANPRKSGDERMVPGDSSVVSQVSPAESTALSESSTGSQDNPWNRLPPISLTLDSSEDKASQHDLSPKPQQDVAADSNTPDLLEPCSQDSPKRLPQAELVQTSSPSLLHSYRNTSLVGTSTTQATSAAEPACAVPCPAPAPQVSECSLATLPFLSPVFPVLPSSRLQSLPEGTPHREQADSSGTDFPPDMLERGPARAKTQEGDAGGTKRKLVLENDQQHPQGASWGRGRDTGRSGEFVSTRGAKKSRKEPGKELSEEEDDEEERAPPVSGPSSRPEQRRALEPYVKKQPDQYKYDPPSPELCEQIRSVRISKAMLKWACWILTDGEVDS